jgi:hypothetical protein
MTDDEEKEGPTVRFNWGREYLKDAIEDWKEAAFRDLDSRDVERVDIDPAYLNKDGTANLRKKIPKEWQEEWK